MPTFTFTAVDATPTGDDGTSAGTLRVTPMRLVKDGFVRTGKEFSVPLVGGAAEVALDVTVPGEAYKIVEQVAGGNGGGYWVVVKEGDTTWADLEVVSQPGTSLPTPIWEANLVGLRSRVDVVEGIAEASGAAVEVLADDVAGKADASTVAALASSVVALPSKSYVDSAVAAVPGATDAAVAPLIVAPLTKAALDAARPLQVPRARGVLGRGLAPVAGRYGRFDFSGQSNGTDLTANSKLKYTLNRDAINVFLVYYNSWTNPLTLSASLNQTKQVTFNGGATSAVLNAKQWVVSDPIPLRGNKGTDVYAHTFMSIASGLYNFTHTVFETGEAAEKGPALADKTMSGTITNSGGGTFGPVMMAFQLADNSVVVSGLGDSVTGGAGAGTDLGNSYVARAFSTAKLPCIITQRAGESAQAYRNATDVGSVSWSDPLPNSNARYMLADAGNWLLYTYGINDLRLSRTADQLANDMLWACRAHAVSGQRVVLTLPMPSSTSSDGFATPGNQTINATIQAQYAAYRVWARAGAPCDPTTFVKVAVGTSGALVAGDGKHPLYKVIDFSSAVEDGLDTMRWKSPGYTTDGLHPTAVGHAAAAAVIVAAMASDPFLFAPTYRIP